MNVPNEINWQQFIRENIEPKIKKDTLLSWKRSQAHKINPYMENLNSLAKQSFEKTPESKLFFNDIVEYLNRSLDENTTDESAWIFCNQDGIVLKIRTNSEYFKQEMYDLGFKERVSLAEDSIGTNAISMAMHTRERSICVESEHYLKVLHKYKAAANPVFNIEGTLMGYCMLIAKKHFIRTTTLNMMLLLMIEGVDKSFRLLRSRGRHDNLKDKIENALFENHLVSTVFLNNNGFIRHLNNSAMEMLEVDVDTRNETDIAQVADFTPSIKDIAKSGLETKNIELSIQTKSGKIINVIANRLPYYNKKGQFLGVSLQLFEKEKIQATPKSTYTAKHNFAEIIGESQFIKRAKEIALRVAETNINVLLIGSSGTGKEMFAQSIHNASDRKNGPFVSINCAAIQKETAEIELFGGQTFIPGSDTQTELTIGKLEAANNGTIFLDEIGDLSLEIQAKLLRILEERKMTRQGESVEIPLDIRIIAATNKDLIDMVQKNDFREDLYYRLSVTSIQLPSLKQSKEDVPLLVASFLEHYNEQMGKKVTGFKEEIMERLMVYDWPGNIRELRNTVEFAIMLNQGSEFITWEHMPGNLRLPLLYNKKTAEDDGDDPLDKEREGISKSEIALIKKAIKISNGKMNEAAKILGVSRATIYRKIKKLGISPFA